MTTDSDQEKELEELHDKLDKILDFLNKILQFLNKILQALKDKIGHTKLELVVYILMFFVYLPPMMEHYGWMGIIITIITFFGLIYFSKDRRNAKRDVPDDLGNENAQINKTGMFTKGQIVIIIIIVLVIYSPLFIVLQTYFVNPEITITSPSSGDVVKIDKDNTFLKISGNSKGLTNTQFLHLFILYRRVDSNQVSGKWNSNFDHDSCTVYSAGSWDCRIQLQKLYTENINGTLIVKSPSNSSNNISTNVDITAIITKQSIEHSILAKLITRRDEVDDVDGPDWYKKILFWSPTGQGTFYDPYYDPRYDLSTSEYYDWHHNRRYHLPKHLADDHVTITPLIVEPFNLTTSPQGSGSPHGLQVCIYPSRIPADNVTDASVEVHLISSADNYVHSEGRVLNLTCTIGNLSTDHIITNSQGGGVAYISSGELGESLILVQSRGLNNGTGQITYTLPPVVLEFNQWVMSSPGDDETSELTANFQTMHDAEYSVALTGWGTEANWPFKPEEWPIVRVEVDGITLGDIEVASGCGIEVPIGNVQLNAGKHTLRLNLTNNFAVPLIGERNLYVERVEFS